MSAVIHNNPFQGKGSSGNVRQFVFTMSSGSATLQALAGNDPDSDTWVAVSDGAYTSSSSASMFCAPGMLYRWVLTGDAAGWMSS